MISYKSVKIPVTAQGVYSFNVTCYHPVKHVKVRAGFKFVSDTDSFFLLDDFSMFNNNNLTSTGEQYFITPNYYYTADLSSGDIRYSFNNETQIQGSHNITLISPTDPDATLEGTVLLQFEFRN